SHSLHCVCVCVCVCVWVCGGGGGIFESGLGVWCGVGGCVVVRSCERCAVGALWCVCVCVCVGGGGGGCFQSWLEDRRGTESREITRNTQRREEKETSRKKGSIKKYIYRYRVSVCVCVCV